MYRAMLPDPAYMEDWIDIALARLMLNALGRPVTTAIFDFKQPRLVEIVAKPVGRRASFAGSGETVVAWWQPPLTALTSSISVTRACCGHRRNSAAAPVHPRPVAQPAAATGRDQSAFAASLRPPLSSP